MKKIQLILLLLILSVTAFPQEKVIDVGENFSVAEKKDIFIYDYIENSKENKVLKAERNGKNGLVDIYGKERSPFIYDYIRRIKGTNIFQVDVNKQLSLINLEKTLYEDFPSFRYLGEDMCAIADKIYNYALCDTLGNIYTPHQYRGVGPFYGGIGSVQKADRTWSLVDKHGKIILDTDYELLDMQNTRLAQVRKDDLRGVINTKGEIIIPLTKYFMYYEEKFKIFTLFDDKSTKYIYDDDGNEISPEECNEVEYLYGTNRLRVSLASGKTGIIDTKGKIIVPFEFDKIYYRKDDSCYYTSKEDRQGVYGFDGKELLKPVYYSVKYAGNVDYFFLSKEENGLWALYDVSKNKPVTGFEYKDCLSSYFDPDIFMVSKDSGWGYVDANGNEITDFTCGRDDVYPFVNGLATVKKYGKTGFIDMKGNVVVPFEYRSTGYFTKGGLCSGSRNGKFGIIDKDNNIVLPFDYDDLTSPWCDDEIFIVKQNGKYGAFKADNLSEEYIPIKYESINCCDGFNIIVKKGGKYGFLDKKTSEPIEIEIWKER